MRNLIWLIISIIDFIFAVIIIGLLFRFVLRLFAADPKADFSSMVYENTATFVQPFSGLFSNFKFGSAGVVEVNTLIALIVFIMAAFLVTEVLLNIRNGITEEKTETRRG